MSMRPLKRESALVLAILMATVALQFDLSQPLGVSAGMPYVILPLLGLLARSAAFIIAAALAGSALIGLGLMLSMPGVEFSVVAVNRGMSVVLLWVTALMALHHLSVGNNLAKRLRDLAATDPLTGLYNRRHVFEVLRQELKRYERYSVPFAVVLIDADHFKQINDKHGHAVGDATLCWIASTCLNSVRETDVVGRFGGEEFLILMPHTTSDEAAIVAERIRLAMHNKDARDRGEAAEVTLSFGVAEAGVNSETFNDILKAADQALYAAKGAGRDRIAKYSNDPQRPHSVQAA